MLIFAVQETVYTLVSNAALFFGGPICLDANILGYNIVDVSIMPKLDSIEALFGLRIHGRGSLVVERKLGIRGREKPFQSYMPRLQDTMTGRPQRHVMLHKMS